MGGDIVVMIPVETWRAVVKIPGLSAYLLDEAERGGAEAVQSALDRYLELGPAPC